MHSIRTKKKPLCTCLTGTLACVLLCWAALLLSYWRSVGVRAVVDEFYIAETELLRQDLDYVSEKLDKNIIKGLLVKHRPLPERVDGLVKHSENAALGSRPPEPQSSVTFTTAKVVAEPQRELDHTKDRYGLRGTAESSTSKEPSMHVAFSTDCSPFQDWQTLLVFHSGKAVGQKGPMTRIASGCNDEKKVELTQLYKKLYPDYYVHFTPDFKKDAKTKKKYDFYNKPYGVQHWLENADPPIRSGVIVAIIDPDFVFLRPLTARVKGRPNNLYSTPVTENDIVDYVSRGKPVAQHYGMGAPWTRESAEFNRARICGPNSPCLKVPNEATGARYWAVGPPYMLERDDLYRLTNTWADFVPRVYEGYPMLLAEMYAYSMAGAHEELPHLRMDNYMVSNVDVHQGEGWKWVDALDDVCQPPVNGKYFPGKPLPNFLHYCQFYRSREIGFQKRRVKKDIFSCEQDLLLEPPEDLAHATYMMRNGNRESMGPTMRKRNGFALCVLHRSINAAAMDYKKRMCQDNPRTSYNKTINVILNEHY